ncbi:GOLPH3/VPS74 family protein [Pengzhenrongella sp.]|jgi:hypothetical protein|uniref:GOLPH3/VPS74 family protein n=1 Tax=Pengzhenrongella sp. TaxID=2888820 RepID=UPI002F9354E5
MTALLLAEELFLLAHDDESGKPGAVLALDNALAGALLLDLAAVELVHAEGKSLTAVEGTPAHPLLAAAHAELLASDAKRTAQHWVNHLPKALKPLRDQVGRSLAERGVLSEERGKILGIFDTVRWPEIDPAPEHELRSRLKHVLVYGNEAEARTELLIALLSPLGLVREVVDKQHRKQAEHRAKDISQHSATAGPTSAAVARSVQAVQAAIVAAAIVPVIAVTT